MRFGALLKRVADTTGFYGRQLRTSVFPGVVVLSYHGVRASDRDVVPFAELHVTAARLAEHCRMLAERCHPISLQALIRSRRDGVALPPRPVLVTFDDGYRSVLTRALPALERFNVPATVFASTGPIERQRCFWYDAAARALGDEAVERIKYLPYDEWRRVVGEVSMAADRNDHHAPMTVQELQQLAAHPLVTIGSHTISHPILALAPPEVQQQEIHGSRLVLQEWLGREIDAFAYPNGDPDTDYTAETVALVRSAGYGAAFTIRQRLSAPTEPLLECSRFVMLDAVTRSELSHRLAFSWRREAP